ncbi:hypothetical protein BHM03_00026535 [Ensete ventricosum]|uniref:Uncharacterized protein n=1 Tax=Ensete ventricosum TaxID=4639 RepID=A0A445MHG1_ENSVE|nr:hypothetical protein BHM03_00026535 [Ensete ventricosum]
MSVRFKAALPHRSCLRPRVIHVPRRGRTVPYRQLRIYVVRSCWVGERREEEEEERGRSRETDDGNRESLGTMIGALEYGSGNREGVGGNAGSSCVGQKHGRKHRGRMTGGARDATWAACVLAT